MNPTPDTLGDVKLSYRFIVLGLVSFILYMSLFFTGIPDLQEGIYRANHIWTLAHLFLLGFLIMIVMGVMYQLIPVALLIPIYSQTLSRIQFWVYVIGVAGLTYGLWNMLTGYMVVFGSLAFTGVLLFVINIFLSARKIAKWNMMSVIIISAVFYLFMTVLWGLGLVTDYQYTLWPNYHDQILYTHILFGVVGWLTTLIIGFSYKMAPMFSLAHGYSDRLAKWIFGGLQSGIIISVIGVFSKRNALSYLGIILIVLSFFLFAIQIRKILKKKMKAKLDIGFRVSMYSINFTTLLLIVAPIGFIIWQQSFVLPFVYLFITGWIGLSILGYLYKIVPFLWWTDKYSGRVGKEKVPMLKDMTNEEAGKWAFLLIFIGIIGNSLGIGIHLQNLLYLSSFIFLVGGLLYVYLVLKIFKM